MKCIRVLFLLGFLVFSFAPCFAHHMAVIVNKDNNTGEITSARLAKIFRLETRKWVDGKDVVIVLHKDLEGETLTLERLNKMSSNELKSFISSHKESLTFVDSDADVLRFVAATPGAVGLVEVRSIDDQVNVLKVDGKLPMETGYLPH
jgi:ABC-type phosphate transport system substrate-binding protein